MILNPPIVSPDNFSEEWGTTETGEALGLSRVDNAGLKDCIVAASASVWGVLMMHPAQLEACYCLLHPHRPNALVVVHRMGLGKTHILPTFGVIECGIGLIFILLLAIHRHDA
jgi:hypothetical protein